MQVGFANNLTCGTDDKQLRPADSKAQEINCIKLHCTSLQLAELWTQCLLQQHQLARFIHYDYCRMH